MTSSSLFCDDSLTCFSFQAAKTPWIEAPYGMERCAKRRRCPFATPTPNCVENSASFVSLFDNDNSQSWLELILYILSFFISPLAVVTLQLWLWLWYTVIYYDSVMVVIHSCVQKTEVELFISCIQSDDIQGSILFKRTIVGSETGDAEIPFT